MNQRTRIDYEDRTVSVIALKGWQVMAIAGIPLITAIFGAGILVNQLGNLQETVNEMGEKLDRAAETARLLSERLVKLEVWRDGPRRGTEGNGGGPFRDALPTSEAPR